MKKLITEEMPFGKRRQENGINWLSAKGCQTVFSVSSKAVKKIAERHKWRRFQLPSSSHTFYAEDDVMQTYRQCFSTTGEKK